MTFNFVLFNSFSVISGWVSDNENCLQWRPVYDCLQEGFELRMPRSVLTYSIEYEVLLWVFFIHKTALSDSV